jgi:hypothetical protein
MNMKIGLGISTIQPTEQPRGSTSLPKPESSESLAPDPATRTTLSDDAIYEIAALLAESANGDRKHARGMRNARERTMEAATAKRIQAMRDKADAMRTAAVISGATGMAAGACQVAGGLRSMSEAAKIQTSGGEATLGYNSGTQARTVSRPLSGEQSAQNDIVKTNAGAYGQLGGGIGGFLQSGGAMVAGLVQASAEEYEADAARHQSNAARAERAVEQHTGEMSDARTLMNKVMEFLKEIRTSQNGAAQAAIRG